MHLFQKGLMAAGVGLVLAAGTVGVFAADDKEAVIKTRGDFMGAQQKAVGQVQAFAKGTGDRAGAIDGVTKLVAMSTELEAKFIAFFPPGTSNVDFPKLARAKPELWQGTNLDQAKAAIPKMHDAQVKLLEVVKTADAETVGKAMSDNYRDTCNGLCHNAYRGPEIK